MCRILNASAFTGFLIKNQFTPAHPQRRANPPHPEKTKCQFNADIMYFFIKNLENKLFPPQIPLDPKKRASNR